MIRPRDQALVHRVQMHIIQAFAELFLVAHESVPEPPLPDRTFAAAMTVHEPGREPFDVLKGSRNGYGILCADQRMPVIGHKNIAAQQKWRSLPANLQRLNKQGKFALGKVRNSALQVHGDKENPVGNEQAANV